MSLDKHQRGDVAEAAVISAAIEMGFQVSLPLHSSSAYDIALDADDLYKVQVKNATTHDNEPNSIRVELRRRSYRNGGQVRSDAYSSSEVDAYAIYWHQGDEVLWVPFEEAPEQTMNIYVGDVDDLRPVDRSKARVLEDCRLCERLTPQ